MDTLIEIAVFSALVLAGVTALAAGLVYAGYGLAAEAVETHDDAH